MTYSTIEVAARMGLARSTVAKYAKKLGIEKIGRDYRYDTVDIVRITGAMEHAHPGRPRELS